MAIIPRANPGQFQTDLVGINARNEVRVSNAAADAINAGTRAATQALGAFAQVAEREQQKADIASYQEAQRKLDAWEESWNDPNNAKGFYSYKGRDALGLKDALVPDFDKTAGEVAATLSPRAKQQFDAYVATRRHDIANRANSYATREYDQWRDANSKAWEVGQVNNVVRAYQDGREDEAINLLGQTMQTMAAESVAEGRPAVELSVRQAALTSQVHQSILGSLLVSDPLKARDYFEAHKDELLPNARTEAEAKVQVYGDDAEADQVVADHASGQVPVRMDAGDARAVQTRLGALGDQYGFQTTSTVRTPEENAKVNGVAHSQHLSGTARDWSVKGKSPAEVQAFAAALRAEGFEVITRDHGTGPHVHAELPPGAKVAQRKPPETLGELVEAVRSDPRLDTPAKRKAAERKARDQWQVREADEADRKRAALERANVAVETGDPSVPLRTLLGDDFLTMAAGGYVDALEARLKQRRTGAAVVSNPTVVAAMEEAIYRARAGGEAAQAGLRAIEPYDPTLQLSPEDRKRLGEAKIALLSGDAKQVAKAATEAEFGGVIKQYRVVNLGLSDKAIKDSSEKQAQAVAFDQQMRAWRSQFVQANGGREPTYLEVRKQADMLTLQNLHFNVERNWLPDKDATVADLKIEPEVQSYLVDKLREAGAPITGPNVAQAYKNYLAGAR